MRHKPARDYPALYKVQLLHRHHYTDYWEELCDINTVYWEEPGDLNLYFVRSGELIHQKNANQSFYIPTNRLWFRHIIHKNKFALDATSQGRERQPHITERVKWSSSLLLVLSCFSVSLHSEDRYNTEKKTNDIIAPFMYGKHFGLLSRVVHRSGLWISKSKINFLLDGVMLTKHCISATVSSLLTTRRWHDHQTRC